MAGGLDGKRRIAAGNSFVFAPVDLGMIARTFSILTDTILYDGYQIYA